MKQKKYFLLRMYTSLQNDISNSDRIFVVLGNVHTEGSPEIITSEAPRTEEKLSNLVFKIYFVFKSISSICTSASNFSKGQN